MPHDRYTDHPALKPTILASALKSLPRPAEPSARPTAAEDHEARETPRAA